MARTDVCELVARRGKGLAGASSNGRIERMTRQSLIVLAIYGKCCATLASSPPQDAVVIPIDFIRPSIRVVTTKDLVIPERVLLDVGFSSELLAPPISENIKPPSILNRRQSRTALPHSDEFEIQEIGIKIGEAYDAIFPADIPNVKIGARFVTSITANSVRVDIELRYILPDGSIQVLTRHEFERVCRFTSRGLADGNIAARELPDLRSELATYRAIYNASVATANPTSVQVRLTGNTRLAAVSQRIEFLQKKVADYEDGIKTLTALQKNAEVLDDIKAYMDDVAPAARIYVRLHIGSYTVPAAIRR
jgi:hypothetical protein